MLGLVPGIDALCGEFAKEFGLRVAFDHEDVPDAISADAKLALFRITQEALHNALRHSGAGRVGVTLVRRDQSVVLSVTDDGCGFDPNVEHGPSSGMSLMPYRAGMFGGTLTITSSPNAGTKVECRFVYSL